MDAYQESIPTPTGSNDFDRRRSECVSSAPTYSDVAEWQAESARFLDDVTQRLNDILGEVNQTLADDVPAELGSVSAGHNTNTGSEHHRALTEASGDNRISALKARLAHKLHDFEATDLETTDDRTTATTFAAEAGR